MTPGDEFGHAREHDQFKVSLDRRFGELQVGVDRAYATQQAALQAALIDHHREHQVHERNHEREHETANIALSKAELGMDRRLEAMNEFRSQLNQQATTFLTRSVFETYVRENESRREAALASLSEKYDTVMKSIINRHDVDFENLRDALQIEREIRKTFEGSVNTFKYLIGLVGVSGLASIVYLFLTKT